MIKIRDVAEIERQVVKWLVDYRDNTACKGVVLGISGGKDSTTVAMLAKKVWGENVVGVLMPNSKQSDIDDSIEIAETLGLKYMIVDIGGGYNGLLQGIEKNPVRISDKAKTNIPPRLRMATLYAIAQTYDYRVIGTGNMSEGYIGWCTKWGDMAYDLNPLNGITCTEVMELGKLLAAEYGLKEKFAFKTPADGLSGRSDEENFGFTYETLDNYILNGICPDEAIRAKIDSMHRATEHKRTLPYRFEPTVRP